MSCTVVPAALASNTVYSQAGNGTTVVSSCGFGGSCFAVGFAVGAGVCSSARRAGVSRDWMPQAFAKRQTETFNVSRYRVSSLPRSVGLMMKLLPFFSTLTQTVSIL